MFKYGNYDSKNQLPQFDLHIGVDFWDTVTLEDASTKRRKEIIHTPTTDYLHVCLINTGRGIPFISALELRPLHNSTYQTHESESLNFIWRLDLGSRIEGQVRYKDDIYDRIWNPFNFNHTASVTTSFTVKSNSFQLPSIVMSTAMIMKNTSEPLCFYKNDVNLTDKYYIYLHFAELQELQTNQSRIFNINLNGKLWYDEPIVPNYLSTNTIYSTSAATGPEFQLCLVRTNNSTLPPIINALEVFTVKQLLNLQTDDGDVDAIVNIKSMYNLTLNWQGDPCSPEDYKWVNLSCSSDASNQYRIISLNLSTSGLTGEISPSISSLTMLQSLDLSNNNLSGKVPDFLSGLASLRVLNLKGNNFSGSVPTELLERSKTGSLSLSIDEVDQNIHPCQSAPCEKKKNNVVPVVASVAAVCVLFIAMLAILWIIKRKKQVVKKVKTETNRRDGSLELQKKQYFTYSEVLEITNNLQRVVGKGGFGTVYHGYIGDTQVAVKMLSPSSIQGYKEFQAEVNLLMSVHHKNLTALVGYCIEGTHMGIIYEYMANGNLKRHMSDRNPNVLRWEDRVQIAMDVAQGLEYLHHGCKPPIIHRDVKPANILLNAKYQAKLADFGLSRAFPTDSGTSVPTKFAGTAGYLDPEYCTSNRFTEKTDVYSFGIVLLELITNRPPTPEGNGKTGIIQWVKSIITKGDINKIVDPRLQGDFDVNSVWKAVELAMACVSHPSTRRPTMKSVVSDLNGCLATGRTNRNMELQYSIEMIPMNLDTGAIPQAR
ncbi:hypothetical protein F0562_024763 [Nyssa sinensis]|uniref:non-specific serine/threonine protein kinase n=1 Tax=Nyssa sinensis TaxID=561372 RepID=A0A5J5BCA4_9ASTE|nr:hypothetical protein F0562_024763 [Nyssa sinensis]